MKKLNIKGFSHIEAFTLLIVVVVVSLVGYKVLTGSHADNLTTASATVKVKINKL